MGMIHVYQRQNSHNSIIKRYRTMPESYHLHEFSKVHHRFLIDHAYRFLPLLPVFTFEAFHEYNIEEPEPEENMYLIGDVITVSHDLKSSTTHDARSFKLEVLHKALQSILTPFLQHSTNVVRVSRKKYMDLPRNSSCMLLRYPRKDIYIGGYARRYISTLCPLSYPVIQYSIYDS